MQIVLRDKNPSIVAAWRGVFTGGDDCAFFGQDSINIREGDIFTQPCTEAVVSPANSFGFMNGGIDGVYAAHWPHIEAEVRNAINTHSHGELPVGSALLVPLHYCDMCGKPTDEAYPDFQSLIVAPTMRTPCDVSDTINAYLAFRAVLICARQHNLSSITCPGLGTAVGKMPPMKCAWQMFEAFESLRRQSPRTITEAFVSDLRIRRDLLAIKIDKG